MYMDFAEKLTTAMRKRNVTAKELAMRSGISESRISQYRKGVYEPKNDAMNKLAIALSVNPNWFNGTSDEIETYTSYCNQSDLTPFDMRLLNSFHEASNDVKTGICMILGVKVNGMAQTKRFSEEEINNY